MIGRTSLVPVSLTSFNFTKEKVVGETELVVSEGIEADVAGDGEVVRGEETEEMTAMSSLFNGNKEVSRVEQEEIMRSTNSST